MIEITLYTKEGCHLCDTVKADLAALKTTHPHFHYHLREIDITQDDDLFKRYRYTIPVLTVDSTTLKAPIDIHQLMNALKL